MNISETIDTSVESSNDDLDSFSADFFGQKSSESVANTEDTESDEDAGEDNRDALEDNTHDSEDNVDTAEDSSDEDNQDDEAPIPLKPKKNRFQERIDELTAKAREAERKYEELAEKLEQSVNKKNTGTESTEDSGDGSPDPTAQNEDGTDKYPLGEFDPAYIKDLTRYTLHAERQALLAQEKEDAEKRMQETEKQKIVTEWQGKFEAARERYPDFQEKAEQVSEHFSGLNEAYSDYLSATIMSMDHGPDVLYHLVSNPEEARQIFESGPTKATIALGRLEARYQEAAEEKKTRLRVSNAPVPPARLNRGSAVARIDVPDDTDDLDAFASKLFKKRRN